MSTTDRMAIEAEILGVLKCFPSYHTMRSADLIDLARAYVEPCLGLPLEAIRDTARMIARGEVARSHPFPPSVPEFASAARIRSEQIRAEQLAASKEFVEKDSVKWRAICAVRGKGMPEVERDGKVGWYVPKDEIAALPPPVVEKYRALRDGPRMALPAPKMQRA